MKKFLKRHAFTVFVIFGAVFGIGMFVAAVVAGVGATTTPMLTWGYAQFVDEEGHGEPIPIGTLVEVFIGDDVTPSGTVNTTVPGFYGSIMVTGDTSRYGEELHYSLDAWPTVKIGPDAGVFGLENQVVNIYADKTESQHDPMFVWDFFGPGFHPKHLPDWYYGTIDLSLVQFVDNHIQAVYYFNDDRGIWLFWCKDAPGNTLHELKGGKFADYLVATTSSCTWEIEVQ